MLAADKLTTADEPDNWVASGIKSSSLNNSPISTPKPGAKSNPNRLLSNWRCCINFSLLSMPTKQK